MRAEGNCTRGGSWSGAHVPLPTAPVVHQRPHITQLAHAADRTPTVTISPEPAPVKERAPRKRGGAKPGPAKGSISPRAMSRERIDQIIATYAEGGSAVTVAERLGLSHTTVIKYLRANGVTLTRKGRSASRKPAPVASPPKVCAACGNAFERREGEKRHEVTRFQTRSATGGNAGAESNESSHLE